MKHRSFIIIILLIALVASGSAPRRGTFLMYQPDGSSFLASLKGDEFAKVLTTADGHTVTKGEDGFYRYAFFNPDGSREISTYKVGDNVPSMVLDGFRYIPWRALREKAAKVRSTRRGETGNYVRTRASQSNKKHCIVILAQFQDKTFLNGESRRQEFMDLITKEGSNSVLDYFNDQFKGSYEFNFTIGPVVTLPKDLSYYGKNEDDKAGRDTNPQELVRDACMLSDMVPTGFHGVELADVQFGDSVLVIGIGPVGLMSVAGCALRGASRIIAVGTRPNCVEAAKFYGADEFIS